MKEKPKSKFHPFAGYLLPSEEVLWMSPQAELPFWQKHQSPLVFAGLFAVFVFYGLINLSPQGRDLAILIGSLLLMLACTFVPLMGYLAFKQRTQGELPPEHIYAVTNERLLYRNKDKFSRIALEDVSSVSVLSSVGTTGSLSFGPFFPTWEGVENVISVQQMIDSARAERLRALGIKNKVDEKVKVEEIRAEEKPRSKSNPFAQHLRPTERLLWTSGQSEDGTWSQIRVVFRIFLSILAFIVVMGMIKDARNIPSLLAVTTLIACFFAFVVFLGWGVERIFGSRHPQRIYAVTNERLLYYHMREIISIDLEDVPSVSLFRGEGDKGTLNFGNDFPMWPDIEKAATVKRGIEKAQKRRLEEHSLA